MTIVTTVTTATTLFASIFPALNGFCWVNGFLYGRPTFPPARESAPFFHLAQFSPAALHPIPKATPTPFWENFLPALTHPAGWSSFYSRLLLRGQSSPLFMGCYFSPEGVSRSCRSQSPPFWENFLRDQTHPAGCSLFYTLLLFVRVFVGLVYGGPVCPGCHCSLLCMATFHHRH